MTKSWLAMLLLVLAGCGAREGNRNVESTWGLDRINAAAGDKENVVLPVLKCEREGFVEDASEYRAWAVKRSAPDGRIVATVPSAGAFYPAFIFYDSAGKERISIRIDGREVGVAAAGEDDNRQKLFFLTTPQTFRGGEKIELRALTADGVYRTEDLLLLRKKPEARPRQFTISEVSAQARDTSAAITWLTSWPAACTVETDTGKVAEQADFNNHRVKLQNLAPGRGYRYRVVARTPEGAEIASPWQEFRTELPAEPQGKAGRERLALKLEPGSLPVSAGIPFPKGMLGSASHLRVLDAQSAELPSQARVLGRWPDGSVKWALLDFDSARPGAAVEYGEQVSRAGAPSALRVSQDAEAVNVDAGRLKFRVSKRRFGLMDTASLDGQPMIDQPAAFTITGPDGVAYSSLAPPEEVAVDEAGPVRACIRVRGRHHAPDGKTLFPYTVRLHAWAGRPFVRIQHTFGNDNGSTDFTSIRELTLRLPLAWKARQWNVAGHAGSMKEPVALKQHTDDRYLLEPGAANGKRAAGWAELSDGTHSATLALRDLWQNYPKDLKVTADGFEVGLCPSLKPDEYDAAKGTIDEHRIYYYLQGGVYKLRQGVTKTHDIWLEFGKPAQAAVRAEQRVRTALAPPAWYSSSGALGELSVPKPSPILRQYDQAFAASFDGYLRNREVNREFGMLNFGDWWGERIINWGNSEYDTQHAFLLQFLRTGDWRYFRAAEEMEWHNRDIDAVHYHTDPRTRGAVYAHAIGHTGAYYNDRPTAGAPPGGFKLGSPQSHFAADHTFIEGHIDYYFLTGDTRSLDTALLTADRYDGYFTRNHDFNNCRQPGWHLILTLAAYDATGDTYYRNAARMIVERVLERQTPDGGWKRQMVPGHCFCTPRHQGNAGFMVGVLLTGLRWYYDTTGDERVAKSIVRGAHFLIDDMWVPKVKGFRYTSCPNSSSGPWSNFLLFDGIVFAHRRTGEARLAEVLLAGTDSALETMAQGGRKQGTAWGKGFSQYTRVVPRFIDHLAALKTGAAAPRTD